MKKNDSTVLTFLFVLLLLSISFFLISFFQIEHDYFWHIKAGSYMIQNKVILTHDIFSWNYSGNYWMSHEWLFEIFIYFLKILFGKYHSILYSFLSLISLFLFLFFTNKKNYLKNVFYTIIFLFFFVILFLGFIQVRPHMISFLFLAFTIWVLYDLYQNSESKKIYFLPFLTILWSNFHGGSSNLSYIFCFLFFLGGCFSFHFKKLESNRLSKKQLKKYFIVMLLCIGCVCINIHGIRMLFYPYENMLDSTMLSNIDEWKGTSLSVPYHYFYYSFLLFLFFTMLLSNKKIQWMDLILFGFVSYLGLKSVRFWIYTPIIMNYAIFPYVKTRKMFFHPILVFSLLVYFFFGYFCYIINDISIQYRMNLNSSIVSLLKKEKPKRLFNNYDFGGELIYHDFKVFIDGRADFYGKYNYKDYLNIIFLRDNVDELISKYDFDYFLVMKDCPLAVYLRKKEGYEIIYDKDLLLYKKIVNN